MDTDRFHGIVSFLSFRPLGDKVGSTSVYTRRRKSGSALNLDLAANPGVDPPFCAVIDRATLAHHTPHLLLPVGHILRRELTESLPYGKGEADETPPTDRSCGAKTTIADVWKWGQEPERLHSRIARRFVRPEPRRRALAYLKGIVSATPCKNGWQLAEHAGESRPDGMQRLLNSAVWDADLVRDDLRAYILERLGDPHAVLVIDETSFRKRGKKSAGVKKQYCGTTGMVENCQVGVFLAYSSPKGCTLLDRELYLPKEWIDDSGRRWEAGISDWLKRERARMKREER